MSEADPGAGTLPTAAEQTSPLRMVATLGGAGALAGLLIVVVFTVTLGPIEAYKARVLRRAVSFVLNDPVRYDTLYATSERVFESPPDAAAAATAEKIYIGFDADGEATGVAVKAAAAGFQDTITLIYGFDPATGKLLGMKVLDNRETPGLGDKIEKDLAFVAQFEQAVPPLEAVKRATGTPGEIDAITGATISSRAVVRIINESLARLRAPIEAHFLEASR
ncbi:MAG: RnfABCDGE type electron transport complex subunit G [Myxococcota bacterium]